MMYRRFTISLLILAGLSACGSKGTPQTQAVPTQSLSLAVQQLNPQTQTVSTQQDWLTVANQGSVASGLAAVTDTKGSTVKLADGGLLTIDAGPTNAVRNYSVQLASGAPGIGVIGCPANFAMLPSSGMVRYTDAGQSKLQIIDDTLLYDVTGSAVASVDFDANLVNVSMSDLTGSRTDGRTAASNIKDVGTLTITNAKLSNGIFTGGKAAFESDQIKTVLSTSAAVSTSGQIFGSSAEEIGGAVVIDDQKKWNWLAYSRRLRRQIVITQT